MLVLLQYVQVLQLLKQAVRLVLCEFHQECNPAVG